MNIKKSYTTKNPCYTNKRTISVEGLTLHSDGCGQPSAEVWFKKFNSASANKAVHGVIDANSGDVWQFLPWGYRAWHCGGSCNSTHIGIEMGESNYIKYTSGAKFTIKDKAKAQAQAKTAYNSAVSLFAFLCNAYKLDPLGKNVILSHNEAGKKGMASGHADPEHYWKGLGLAYTMDGFRLDVKKAMAPKTEPAPAPAVNGSYKVKITANNLNVRKSASALSAKVTVVHKGGVYTIVEESPNGKWGKLKSGAGWISLKYTVKV